MKSRRFEEKAPVDIRRFMILTAFSISSLDSCDSARKYANSFKFEASHRRR